MEDSTILNIIKDYFKVNFESVTDNYRHDTIKAYPSGIGNSYNTFTSTNSLMIKGELNESIYSLKVDKFVFELVHRIENKFPVAISHEEWHNNGSTFQRGINGQPTKEESYKVRITRVTNRHGSEEQLFKKELDVEQSYYDDIIDSINYNEQRMMEELTELLGGIRDRKIEKLTKEK
jgi:hypothetical protein